MKNFPNSLSPLRIKSLQIKNRYVMSPMETKQARTDGGVSDGIIEYYRRRAEGGVGLIMVEAAYVHPNGKGFSTQLAIDREEMLEGLSRIPEIVHPYGAKVAIQLIHHGRQTESRVLGGRQPVSASPIPYRLGEVPRALTEAEIEELIQAFAEACSRAKQAGFDAAEIHSAHGYLIQTFLSPHSNHREDR
jgi:2,4-dienoyl-CoA reductase-like NADH-dependent reductase (Old Yellow Enzyme family)